jgi:hypothetical protein
MVFRNLGCGREGDAGEKMECEERRREAPGMVCEGLL